MPAKTWNGIIAAMGGPARAQIIFVLAAIFATDAADKGTVSAISDQLKQAFHIGNPQIGLLLAVVSFVSALVSLPMGVLVDRTRRRQLLLLTISLWGVAMLASGIASSYTELLLTRLALGAVIAAATPAAASLIGDFFPARERAGIYGMVLTGELVGSGLGFLIAGEASSLFGWRSAFYVLAALSGALIWLVWRRLPEPERGKQAWTLAGRAGGQTQRARVPDGTPRGFSAQAAAEEPSAERSGARKARASPREELVLREDPTRKSWWWAMGYLFKLPTYLLLIVASSLSYYYFAGVRAFGMIYFTAHYGLARSVVSVLVLLVGGGGVVGLIMGGRLAERLRENGMISARVVLPGIALTVAAVFFGFGIWISSAAIGVVLLSAGAAALAAANPSIDAARLDIVHPRLWGRGEAGRMALRGIGEGAAPLLFGYVSHWLGGGAQALSWTFLMMLVTMIAAASLALPARRSYPRDVATAAASREALSGGEGH